MPERIQLRRSKGWRKPEGAVVVSRPSRWGNPFRVGDEAPPANMAGTVSGRTIVVQDRAHAVRLYRRWLFHQQRSENLIPELRGRDLACWCPLSEPRHADVLLELANRETEAEC